jgi:DNA-binding response OmpR family regulator
VIDDNDSISAAIADYYCMNNISCKEVNDGKSGLFEIQKQAYDLIILDIAMPEFTGLDVLNQLKMQKVSNLNIVILTATGLNKKDFEIYRDVGRIEVIYKPVTLDELDETIINAISSDAPVNQLILD